VATPAPVIVAVEVLDDCQVNVAVVSVLPWAFFAVAENVCVAPAAMVGFAGVTVTLDTLVLSTAGAVGESAPPPHAAIEAANRVVTRLTRMFMGCSRRE